MCVGSKLLVCVLLSCFPHCSVLSLLIASILSLPPQPPTPFVPLPHLLLVLLNPRLVPPHSLTDSSVRTEVVLRRHPLQPVGCHQRKMVCGLLLLLLFFCCCFYSEPAGSSSSSLPLYQWSPSLGCFKCPTPFFRDDDFPSFTCFPLFLLWLYCHQQHHHHNHCHPRRVLLLHRFCFSLLCLSFCFSLFFLAFSACLVPTLILQGFFLQWCAVCVCH